MIALSNIPLNNQKTFDFLKTPEAAKLPSFAEFEGVYKHYAFIEKLSRRDIMNLNVLHRNNDYWRDIRTDYILKRNKITKSYSGFEALRKTCGHILYEEQIEQILLETSDFNISEAVMFRHVLKEGKDRKVAAWKLMYIKRLKDVYINKKDVSKLLESLESVSKDVISGEYAQKESLKIYLNAWFMANHSAQYKENLRNIKEQIELYAEHGIDIGEDFMNFDKQVRKKFKKQFMTLTELFAERSTLLAIQGKYHSALEIANSANIFGYYLSPSSGQVYLKLMQAQLLMDTGNPQNALCICHQALTSLDPDDKDYEKEKKDILGLLEMIEGEMWKGNQ